MPDDAGSRAEPPAWRGATYYDREQVKAAPFNNWLVGGYIFLAGLSGGAALLATLLDLTRPGKRSRATVARGRYLALLAPTIGAAMLVRDLHTPSRFYNMLRVFKTTSPMSIGSWLLIGFGMFSGLTAAAQLAAHLPGVRWLRRVARTTQFPAAAAGAGIATYTASLLSATSTPLWAAAPAETGVRFGASSVASAAAALSLTEPGRSRTRRDLDLVAAAALLVELLATVAAERRYQDKHIAGATNNPPGAIDRTIGSGLGAVLPIGLHLASLAASRHGARRLSRLAACATLIGGATMRIAFLAAGDRSARNPRISMRFAQPDNLPAE